MEPDPDFTPRRTRYDPTVNLGHILTGATTLMAGGLALVTMWTNMKVDQASNNSRLTILEQSQSRTESTLMKVAETEMENSKTQEKLSLTLEFLMKKIDKP